MKNFIILIITMTLLSSCNTPASKKIEYPVSKKGDVVDNYFGTQVPDPYRWMEDDRSKETSDWVSEQNKITFGYLETIPYREEIKSRLEKMWNFEKFTSPYKKGEYTYFSKNDGLQNQYVLYRQKDTEEPEVFLDPNKFSADGTTSLGEIEFSSDGSKVSYSISEGGSDWRKVIVMDTKTKEIIGDTIVDVKFSGLSWQDNSGFYYSSYDKPEGSELSAKTDHHKLYFHKLGTSQSDDKIVFGSDLKRRYVSGSVTEDGHYLVITAAISTTGNELYIRDLTKKDSKLITVVGNFDNDHTIIDNHGSTLVIKTNLNAPNTRIVSVDASNPGVENWKDLIPETDNVLSPSTGAGYIFAEYMINAISKVIQYDMSGKMIREITLPGVGTASGFSARKIDNEVYYSFTNYITPLTIYRLDPATGNSDVYKKPVVPFNSDDYESIQVFYFNVMDGTRIPMIISYKKGIKLNGKNPTILYGYGGFNISQTPSFSPANAVWLEMGGVYAVPNIRGGGEYGEKWHLAGTKLNKQNVFDDFYSAAEWLIGKYTSPDFLAIRGGSNGGLLVGAVMLQHPERFKVALPAVGVMDMLRYHKFTAGAGWAYDYGTSEDSKEMFEYIYKYSPVHNVKSGVKYPATLVTTGDHDDRVVPAHSFKFAANLQEKQSGNSPVLIRIETKAGHGAGTPVSKTIEQYADIFGFTLWNMGIKQLK